MTVDKRRRFKVDQLGPPEVKDGVQFNDPVINFDKVVTHHPGANFDANMKNGQILGVEDLDPKYKGGDRSYAFIGGEFQEIIDTKVDKYSSLKPDQVLLVKDFILEDPTPSRGVKPRAIGVPSPTAGYVSLVRHGGGMVEIKDNKDGDVIVRVRHLDPVAVKEGDTVIYGQSLGVQSNKGLKESVGDHVHTEMDTRHYQQYKNYIADLVSGRLPVQAEYRADIQSLPIIDDGVLRLGESGERVAALQRALAADGYRGVGNKPIEIDGVYRLNMQGAVLAFQQDHKLPQTGDIDPATYQLALRVNLDKPLAPAKRSFELDFLPATDDALFREQHDSQRGLDPAYTLRPEQMQQWSPPDPARTGRTPQHHDHPDHKLHPPLLEREPALSPPSPAHAAPVTSALSEPDLFDRVFQALIDKDDAALRAVRTEYFQSADGQQLMQEGRELRQTQERKADALALAQGRPLPTDYSIGTLTGKQDPRDWDHRDHGLYSAIRQQLPAHVPDEMAAHVMLQARQAGIHDLQRLEHVSVHDNKAFVTGNNFVGMTSVDLSRNAPPMEDTVQQSQQLDQQLALERQQWLAQQQELARSGPSMSL